ncbi:serine protease [Plakobranchus ocellatus]|uniref:Serine protease n=1 Tax=Plakobranchus ocellatus TaxID=259542 RepID=A0AAV4BW26_9GAST|nr:serine protease [Plakobranchus ocellatus]
MTSSVPEIRIWVNKPTLSAVLLLWSLDLVCRTQSASACLDCTQLRESESYSIPDSSQNRLRTFVLIPYFFHRSRGLLCTNNNRNTLSRLRSRSKRAQLVTSFDAPYEISEKQDERFKHLKTIQKWRLISGKISLGNSKSDLIIKMQSNNWNLCRNSNNAMHKSARVKHIDIVNYFNKMASAYSPNLLFCSEYFSGLLAHTNLCSHQRYFKAKKLISSQKRKASANFSNVNRFRQKRRYFKGKPRSRWTREEFVYGQDDRRRIPFLLMRTFPYSNVVRLSTGCTGTLLTPVHVLTAAHCVHDGHDFRENLEMMRVEVPDLMGVRNFYIEKISIPSRWRHPRREVEHQEAWDYAVVTLSYSIHGRSQFYPLSVPTQGMLDNDLVFLGFMKADNGQDHLWRSTCPGPSNKPLVDRSLIFTHCDSAVGNSGAAVLAKDTRNRRQIIGVLSSTIQVRQKLPPHSLSSTSAEVQSNSKPQVWSHSFSVITALTRPKLWDICRELGTEGVAYGVCPKPQSIPVKHRHRYKNIPFLG